MNRTWMALQDQPASLITKQQDKVSPLDKRAGLMGGDVQVPVCFESREGTALSVAVRGT